MRSNGAAIKIRVNVHCFQKRSLQPFHRNLVVFPMQEHCHGDTPYDHGKSRPWGCGFLWTKSCRDCWSLPFPPPPASPPPPPSPASPSPPPPFPPPMPLPSSDMLHRHAEMFMDVTVKFKDLAFQDHEMGQETLAGEPFLLPEEAQRKFLKAVADSAPEEFQPGAVVVTLGRVTRVQNLDDDHMPVMSLKTRILLPRLLDEKTWMKTVTPQRLDFWLKDADMPRFLAVVDIQYSGTQSVFLWWLIHIIVWYVVGSVAVCLCAGLCSVLGQTSCLRVSDEERIDGADQQARGSNTRAHAPQAVDPAMRQSTASAMPRRPKPSPASLPQAPAQAQTRTPSSRSSARQPQQPSAASSVASPNTQPNAQHEGLRRGLLPKPPTAAPAVAGAAADVREPLLPKFQWSRSAESAADEAASCVVCMNSAATHALVPCGHRIVCNGCASTVMEEGGTKRCPVCRKTVTGTLRIYV